MGTRGARPAALLGVAGLFALGFGAMASVPSHIVGPPPAHTGGFGEPTCLACHLGAELNEPGSTLEVIGLGSTYRPGQRHEVTIRLTSFDMSAAGFQAAFRFAEGRRRGRQAGALEPADARVAIVGGATGDTQYVQHTQQGTATRGQVAEWTFDWRAPRSAETVVLHIAANSGGGDNSPLDDLVYTHRLTLAPRSDR